MASGLSAGVLFSPRQEATRLDAERTQLFLELAGRCSQIYGLDMTVIKQPSKVYEFHFKYDGRAARRCVEKADLDRLGPSIAVGRMYEDVCADLGAQFTWDVMPKAEDPQPTPYVDEVGDPFSERAVKRPQTKPEHAPAIHPSGFDAKWSVPELKEWSSNRGHPVPATITRKGDVIEWMSEQFSEEPEPVENVDPDGG
jgi:hypothetical protein